MAPTPSANGANIGLSAAALHVRDVADVPAANKITEAVSAEPTPANAEERASGAAATTSPHRDGENASGGENGKQAPPPSPFAARIEAFAPPSSAPIELNGPAAQTPFVAATTAAPSAAMPDRAEAIANVVERLVAARDFGLATATSVIVGNRDFGEITVNFAETGNALEVSVTAADPENQRALAAALQSAERPVTRDLTPQASQQSAASMHQDRGTGSQLARDGGSRQARGETGADRQRPERPAVATAQSESHAAQRSGIYV